MTNIAQAHPGVRGVFAANDEMALGAAKALGARAGSRVKVVGFDGEPDGLAAVRAGTMTATVAQQPRMLGRAAVDAALRLVAGRPPARRVRIPVVLVTERNAAGFDR